MKFQSQTIFKTVKALNDRYFLPALQREFVWDQTQVLRLFDSLLQGYPIGSLLLWRPGSAQQAGPAYAFVYEARAGVHNPPAPTSAHARPLFVLDGQQRLTSLSIGLRGSLAEKPKGAHARIDGNWTPRFLHLDLFSGEASSEADEESQVADLRYRLQFRANTPEPSGLSCWFKVAGIYSLQNRRRLNAAIRALLRKLPKKCTASRRKALKTNLRLLHDVVFVNEAISYHLEDGSAADRVLDIFVRANEGGTELSRADLLMSTVTQRWRSRDARKEIRGLVDDLNRSMSQETRGPFSTDFVLKACFVLEGFPVKFRLSNFHSENLHRIEDHWPEIRNALEKGVQLAKLFGLNRRTLTSANALIPIMYYLRHRPDFELRGTSLPEEQNRRRLHRFLLAVLLFRVFRQSSDALLQKMREILERELRHSDVFPLDALLTELTRSRYLPCQRAV